MSRRIKLESKELRELRKEHPAVFEKYAKLRLGYALQRDRKGKPLDEEEFTDTMMEFDLGLKNDLRGLGVTKFPKEFATKEASKSYWRPKYGVMQQMLQIEKKRTSQKSKKEETSQKPKKEEAPQQAQQEARTFKEEQFKEGQFALAPEPKAPAPKEKAQKAARQKEAAKRRGISAPQAMQFEFQEKPPEQSPAAPQPPIVFGQAQAPPEPAPAAPSQPVQYQWEPANIQPYDPAPAVPDELSQVLQEAVGMQQSPLTALQKDADTIRNQAYEAHVQKMKALAERARQASKEIQQAIEKLNKAKGGRREGDNDLLRRNEGLAKEAEQHKKDADDLRRKLEDAKRLADGLEEEKKDCQERLETLQDDLEACQETRGMLEKDLTATKKERDKLKTDIAVLTKNYAENIQKLQEDATAAVVHQAMEKGQAQTALQDVLTQSQAAIAGERFKHRAEREQLERQAAGLIQEQAIEKIHAQGALKDAIEQARTAVDVEKFRADANAQVAQALLDKYHQQTQGLALDLAHAKAAHQETIETTQKMNEATDGYLDALEDEFEEQVRYGKEWEEFWKRQKKRFRQLKESEENYQVEYHSKDIELKESQRENSTLKAQLDAERAETARLRAELERLRAAPAPPQAGLAEGQRYAEGARRDRPAAAGPGQFQLHPHPPEEELLQDPLQITPPPLEKLRRKAEKLRRKAEQRFAPKFVQPRQEQPVAAQQQGVDVNRNEAPNKRPKEGQEGQEEQKKELVEELHRLENQLHWLSTHPHLTKHAKFLQKEVVKGKIQEVQTQIEQLQGELASNKKRNKKG